MKQLSTRTLIIAVVGLTVWLAAPTTALAQLEGRSAGISASAGVDSRGDLTISYVIGSPYGASNGPSAIALLPSQLGASLAGLATPVESLASASLRVFPSPADRWFAVEGIKTSGAARAVFFTVLGQRALDVAVEQAGASLRIDTRRLPNGIYLLRLEDPRGVLLGAARVVISR